MEKYEELNIEIIVFEHCDVINDQSDEWTGGWDDD